MRHWYLPVIAILAVAPVSADDPNPCLAPDMDHVMERECVQSKVNMVMKEIAKAEQDFRDVLRSWSDDEGQRKDALKRFEKSVKAFREYQSAACGVTADSAAGGNGTGDMFLLCQLGLATERLAYLRVQVSYFAD